MGLLSKLHKLQEAYGVTDRARYCAPAADAHGKDWSCYLREQLPPDTRDLIEAVERTCSVSRSPKNEWPIGLVFFEHEAVFDLPLGTIMNKSCFYALFTLFTVLGLKTHLVSHLVRVHSFSQDRQLLEVDCTMHLDLKRSWLVWFLPDFTKYIPLRCTLVVGIKGPSDLSKVELLMCRVDNWPVLPAALRWISGGLLGVLAYALQYVWFSALTLLELHMGLERKLVYFGNDWPAFQRRMSKLRAQDLERMLNLADDDPDLADCLRCQLAAERAGSSEY